jgi:hypothetical protein
VPVVAADPFEADVHAPGGAQGAFDLMDRIGVFPGRRFVGGGALQQLQGRLRVGEDCQGPGAVLEDRMQIQCRLQAPADSGQFPARMPGPRRLCRRG